MKLTARGYRISKKGVVMTSIEKEAIKRSKYEGKGIKESGTYYFFNRKQGDYYIYLP